MKQTAVEWLCEKYHLRQDIEIIKQAKEMEKQQQGYSEKDMRKAYCRGYIAVVKSSLNDCFYEWFEQFKNK